MAAARNRGRDRAKERGSEGGDAKKEGASEEGEGLSSHCREEGVCSSSHPLITLSNTFNTHMKIKLILN